MVDCCACTIDEFSRGMIEEYYNLNIAEQVSR